MKQTTILKGPRPKCPEPSGFNAVKLSSLGNQQHQEGTNGSTPASFEDHELGATGRALTTSLPQQYDEQHSTPGETHSHHALSQLRLIRKRRQESTVNMFDAHLEENVLDVWVELNTMDIFEGVRLEILISTVRHTLNFRCLLDRLNSLRQNMMAVAS